jgi:hypothetical protein
MGKIEASLLLKAFKNRKWHRVYCGKEKSDLLAKLGSLPAQEWQEYSLRVTYKKGAAKVVVEDHHKTKARVKRALEWLSTESQI